MQISARNIAALIEIIDCFEFTKIQIKEVKEKIVRLTKEFANSADKPDYKLVQDIGIERRKKSGYFEDIKGYKSSLNQINLDVHKLNAELKEQKTILTSQEKLNNIKQIPVTKEKIEYIEKAIELLQFSLGSIQQQSVRDKIAKIEIYMQNNPNNQLELTAANRKLEFLKKKLTQYS